MRNCQVRGRRRDDVAATDSARHNNNSALPTKLLELSHMHAVIGAEILCHPQWNIRASLPGDRGAPWHQVRALVPVALTDHSPLPTPHS